MKPQTHQDYKERILRVLVHIQSHLDEALDLEALAGIAHFSPYHFHRIFRGMVGESVMEHVRRLRLERAAQRLKFTDQPVTRVAFDAGYETHEAFTRAFRSMFDDSPSGFRRKRRALPLKKVPSGVHFDTEGRLEGFETVHTEKRSLEVRVEQMDPMRVAFVRHVGPYDQVAETWSRLMSWAGPKGLLGPGMTTLGICHDDPEVTPSDKIRYDACLVVDQRVEPEGDVGVQEITGGPYAVTTHRGPYHKLGDAYSRLFGEWLPASGHRERSEPCFEVYRNWPQNTAPEDLLTDIHLPLEVQ